MKLVSKLIAVFLAAAMIPLLAFNVSAASSKAYLGLKFDDYVTHETPADIASTGDKYYISEYAPEDKGLAIITGKTPQTVEFTVSAGGSFCVYFDIKSIASAVDGYLELYGSDSQKLRILTFAGDNEIRFYNGYHLTGYNSSAMTSIALEYDSATSSCNIYRNGKCIYPNFRIKSTAFSSLTKLLFGFESETADTGVILDNVYVTDKYEPNYRSFAATEYNPASVEKPEFSNAKRIGTEVLVVEDFEYVCSISNQHKQNKIEQYDEEDGNTAMRFQRVNNQDFHLDANEATSYNSDVVVYELDFKILDLNSAFWLTLIGEHGSIFPAEVDKGGTLTINGETIALKANEWYRFAIMVDYYDRFADYYWNGEKISTAALPSRFGVGETAYTWRVHAPASYVDLESDRVDFLVDNMRVYEAEAPIENLSEIKREVVLSDKSVFTADVNRMKAYMKGYISIHKVSGLVYFDGNRVLLENKPYEQDGKTMVNATELDSVLGKASGLSGDVTIENYASSLGLKLSVDTEANTAGMMVLGADKFEFPADEAVVSLKTELAYLNEFLLYDQPSPERIAEDYKSSAVYGVHPRIQATKEDFDRIKSEYNTNAQVKKWVDKILTAADNGLSDDAVVYELRDGVRLQMVSRDVLVNMYTYGLAYQLTGDLKYVTRAYKDLYAVCALFPNWHPTHHIDTGMMSAAVAVGYDWMYHGFTPEQRKVIEEGAYKNGFYHINIAFQTTTGPLTDTGIRIGNHNVITNGGFAMLGMAMFDAYPEISHYIVSNAIHSLGYMLNDFGKDGTWEEGPSYWELTMQYTSKVLSTLKSVFGHCYTLDLGEGLALTAQFMVTMQSENGVYSYADANKVKMYVPELFWLSNKFNQPEITPTVLDLAGGNFRDNEDYVLASLWYDTSTENTTGGMPLDNLFDTAHVGNMHQSYDSGSAFFAFKAGKNKIGHAHLDAGSFIFETMGVRWADDTGYTALGYNQPNFFEDEVGGRRWLAEGVRTKDHNCIEINPALDKGSEKRGEVYMGQIYDSISPVIRYEVKDRGGIVVVDTSDAYKKGAAGVKRGFFFTDNRQSLVIRDEIQLYNETDVNWYLVTPATVTITENGAILTSKGRQLRLEYIAEGDSTIEVEDLYSTKDGMQRITIKTRGSDLHTITVKLTPVALEGSDIDDYNKDISLWTVPDGAIEASPEAESIIVGGKVLAPKNNIVDFYYVEGSLTAVPDITVNAPDSTVDITKGNSSDFTSTVMLTSNTDSTLKNKYTIYFHPIPKPAEFDGFTSLPMVSVEASDEPQAANRAVNVLDGDLSTRWSVQGVEQYIITELDELSVVDKVGLGFTDGSTRQTRITILVSEDGTNFTQVYKGLSKGTSNEYEFYDVGGLKAKYIKIIGDGNTTEAVGGWTSITEVVAVKQN